MYMHICNAIKLPTLVYRIDVHARLLILRKKSTLHGLILVCTFIDFEKKFPPARLFHPARLLVLVCSKFHSWSSTNFWLIMDVIKVPRDIKVLFRLNWHYLESQQRYCAIYYYVVCPETQTNKNLFYFKSIN